MKRKVLFTASTDSHIINFHLPYIQAFSQRGWQVDVACSGMRDIPGADRVIRVPFEKKMGAPSNLIATAQIRRQILQEGYDLISTHTSLAAFFTRLAVLGLRHRPVVVNTVHGYLFDDQTPGYKRRILLRAEQMTAGCTDLLLAMNHWDYDTAKRCHLGKQVEFIPGIGVNFGRFHDQSEAISALRDQLGFEEDAFLLIYAAEFSKRKNQAELIHALSMVPEAIKLLLPGEGKLREECIALAGKLGVSHRVVFPGQVRDMAAWYGAADSAVSSSRSEGLPFNLMESMYFGLPVLASEVKGHTDLITNGETGLLYPYGDIRACAAGMRLLYQDAELRTRLARSEKESVTRYDLSLVLPQVMSYYAAFFPELEPVPQAASPV